MSEQEDFEADLRSLGLEIIKHKDIEGSYSMGLEIDLDTEVDYSHLIKEDFVLKKLTKRQDFFYIALKEYNIEKKCLTLFVGTPISKDIYNFHLNSESSLENKVGTNFPDLCWYHAEGTTELTIDEVDTKFRKDCKMGDLNWYIPSRVIDNFIEIMHTLNQSFLQGLMQHTVIYGPYLMSDKKES